MDFLWVCLNIFSTRFWIGVHHHSSITRAILEGIAHFQTHPYPSFIGWIPIVDGWIPFVMVKSDINIQYYLHISLKTYGSTQLPIVGGSIRKSELNPHKTWAKLCWITNTHFGRWNPHFSPPHFWWSQAQRPGWSLGHALGLGGCGGKPWKRHGRVEGDAWGVVTRLAGGWGECWYGGFHGSTPKWMVDVRDNPNLKWMMTGSSPILRNPHVGMVNWIFIKLKCHGSFRWTASATILYMEVHGS